MPWIRLSDNYIEDEKMLALSDGAFRLWHEAIAYCRRHQTDGLIPFTILRGLRYFTKGREKELASPAREGLSPLWDLIPATGYKVHNYLEWNLSREEEQNEKAGAAARMRKFRSRDRYAATNAVTSTVTNAFVPDRIGNKKEVLEKQTDVSKRAGELLLRYQELYARFRNGAKTRLVGNSLEFQDAVSLCQLWDDDRLDKLAQIVLTTDEPFIARTDRAFKIFSIKASWADDRLRQIESGAA